MSCHMIEYDILLFFQQTMLYIFSFAYPSENSSGIDRLIWNLIISPNYCPKSVYVQLVIYYPPIQSENHLL